MKIDPYLSFQDQTEAAFTFYRKCLGGELNVLRFGDSPGCEDMPDEAKGLVMNAALTVGGQTIMASDCPPGQPYDGIKGFMIALSYEDNAEAERVFNALREGGSVTMHWEETFWAERFGMLIDRFGVGWGVNGKSKMG